MQENITPEAKLCQDEINAVLKKYGFDVKVVHQVALVEVAKPEEAVATEVIAATEEVADTNA